MSGIQADSRKGLVDAVLSVLLDAERSDGVSGALFMVSADKAESLKDAMVCVMQDNGPMNIFLRETANAGDSERLSEAISMLTMLDDRGGLGLEKHNQIRKFLGRQPL